MGKIVKIAPPNSLVVICDLADGVVPEFVADRPVLATDTLITIRCLANMDGETEIRLGPAHEIGRGERPVFDGILKTPTRELVVSTVEREKLLSDRVPSQTTRIRIWTNEPVEPDEIAIGWGE